MPILIGLLDSGSAMRKTSSRPLPRVWVMETLRLEQSEYLYRRRRGRSSIKALRSRKNGSCGSACRRAIATRLHSTIRTRSTRIGFAAIRTARKEYSPFGAGLRHTCLGEELSLQVGRLFVEALAALVDWQTIETGPVEHSAWRHWRPSSRWRITVSSCVHAGSP